MAAALAGEGYLVAVPEVYHEFEPPGTVLAYDAEGSARGNSLKTEKEIDSYDEDTDVTVKFLLDHGSCGGKIASFGVCLGGHLAVRAGLHPDVHAVAAFYPTDLHTGALGLGKCDDTLKRLSNIQAPLSYQIPKLM
jgi:carboxymethylenebutenolidase